MRHCSTQPITCEQARLRLVPAWKEDSRWISEEEQKALEEHLARCSDCAQEYAQTVTLMDLLRQHPDVLPVTEASPLAARMGRANGLRFAGTAAGIAVVLAAGLMFLQAGEDAHVNRSVAALPAPGPDCTIEQVAKDGARLPILYSSLQTSDKEIERFVLNGKHHLVLNRGTSLSVNSQTTNDRNGLLITLQRGEVHCVVAHDGNLFAVHTPHGKAVITGTVFNVKVKSTSSELVVKEGSVSFGSDRRMVDVRANRRSTLQRHAGPSRPLPCDAKALTAWADESSPSLDTELVLRKEQNLLTNLDTLLPYPESPIDLEAMDYESWVAQKRPWFRKQFPWIFTLQGVLAEGGVDADYPELLVESGDIWQIAYPPRPEGTVPVLRSRSLFSMPKAVTLHSGQRQQVVASVPWHSRSPNEIHSGITALKQWLSECQALPLVCTEEGVSEALGDTSRTMGEYLENTGVLLWFRLQEDAFQIHPAQKAEMLDLLKRRIDLAYECKKTSWYIGLSLTKADDACDEYSKRLIDAVSKTVECERQTSRLRRVE